MPSDDITLSTPVGDGSTVRTLADSGGREWQPVVACYATTVSAGANVLSIVQPANGLPVQPATGTTFPVSAVSLPLPGNAAQESGGNLATLAGAVSAGKIQASITNASIAVTGTFFQSTQPISAASLPLPSNAAQETGGNLAAVASAAGAVADTKANNATSSWSIVALLKGLYNLLASTLTVSGTVTANAGTNLNTSALALETGGNLATLAAAVSGGRVLVTTGTVAVTGTFWQATQPISAASLPLPSGASTAAKQPALGTAGTASSDVITVQGIASMTPLLVTASAGTNLNTSALALETGGNLAAAKADLDTLAGAVSASKFQVNITNGSIAVTGTFWQATQPVSIAASVAVTQSGTWTVGISASQTVAVTNAGTFAVQVSSALPAGTNIIGHVIVDSGTITTVPKSSGGWHVNRITTASGTNATFALGAPSQIGGWYLFNNAASIRVIHLYDTGSLPTAGSGTPAFSIVLPPGGGANVEFAQGIQFSVGVGYTITTGIDDADTGSCTALDVEGFLLYK